MKILYQNLEKKLKINFKNKKLLIKSLTHKSYDNLNNNEKIEFLGDRVLGLVIAKKLLEIYPNEKEGILDKKFASLVNKNTCLEIAKDINLQKYILIYKTKNKSISIEDKVVADACEALIGSIYLDKGFSVTEKVILNLWKKHIDQSIITQVDAKTKLQELSLKKFKRLPIYKTISMSMFLTSKCLFFLILAFSLGLNFLGLSLFEYLETSFSLTFLRISLILSIFLIF